MTYCVAKQVTNLVTDQLHNQVTYWLLSTEIFRNEGKEWGWRRLCYYWRHLEVKVMSSLCLNKYCAMNTYGGSGSIAPDIIYLVTRWRLVVRQVPWLLYTQGNSPRCYVALSPYHLGSPGSWRHFAVTEYWEMLSVLFYLAIENLYYVCNFFKRLEFLQMCVEWWSNGLI